MNSSMTASVAAPAGTMSTIRRGRSRESTNSCADSAATKVPSSEKWSTRSFVFW